MESFQQIINGDKPVLIDFYATWCGPCKAMSPVVEAIGKEVQGQARVLKVDVDRNQALASQYNIRSVPTFIIFKNGKVVWHKQPVPGFAPELVAAEFVTAINGWIGRFVFCKPDGLE